MDVAAVARDYHIEHHLGYITYTSALIENTLNPYDHVNALPSLLQVNRY